MKRSIPVLAIILGWATAALAAAPAPITTLRAIHALTNTEASKDMPVAFEATITYYNPKDIDMFVQDGGEAIYVQAARGINLVPGDHVLVQGHTGVYFRPDLGLDRGRRSRRAVN